MTTVYIISYILTIKDETFIARTKGKVSISSHSTLRRYLVRSIDHIMKFLVFLCIWLSLPTYLLLNNVSTIRGVMAGPRIRLFLFTAVAAAAAAPAATGFPGGSSFNKSSNSDWHSSPYSYLIWWNVENTIDSIGIKLLLQALIYKIVLSWVLSNLKLV